MWCLFDPTSSGWIDHHMRGSYFSFPCSILLIEKDRKTLQRYLDVPTTSRRISLKIMDSNDEESWALIEDLTLYDNESWNDPKDFDKPVKAISLPQDAMSTSDFGSESPSPMLNKENYVPWSSRLLRYATSRPNGKFIHSSIINGPYVKRMIPEPGSDIGIQEKKAKLFNEWERNKYFPEKITSNLKFLNNLQLEWSRQVTIVHQTKDLHTADYTQLYDFLKYNQKENVGNLNRYNAVQNVENQVAQNPRVQNVGNQHGLIGVPGNVNQIGNGNLVAVHAEENAAGHNGNQIRCYNCRGVGHFARNCTVRPRRRDVAYLQTQLLIAQKEEAGIQIQAKEFDLMAAAADLDEIEEVNAYCILMANLQQASTSGTQTDKAPVYDSDGSAEVHDYENCDDNEIFNMFTQEEQYTELLEPIPKQHQVPQNDNDVISKVSSVEQSRETVEQHPANFEETRALYDSLYQNLAIEVDKVNSNTIYENAKLRAQLFKKASVQKDNTCGTSKNTKFAKQSILGKPPMLGEIHALSKPVTLNSVPTPQESKVMNKDKVIAPGMFKINPFKTSKEEKHVPNTVIASARTKPITVSQPPVNTKKDVNSDSNGLSSTGIDNTKTRRLQPRSNTKNDKVPSASKSSRSKNKEVEVEEHHRNLLLFKNSKHRLSICNNFKLDSQNVNSKVVCAMCKQCLIYVNHDEYFLKYVYDKNSRGKKQTENVSIKEKQNKRKPKVKKPKKVGFIERLATPKPSKPRSLLRWSPTGRMFDLSGKIIASSEFKSQSDCSKGDNACTSNPVEPTIKQFPNATFSLAEMIMLLQFWVLVIFKGEMTFFLGLQVNQSPCGIFINQSKYVIEILRKYRMKSCDLVGTPMEIKDKLDLDQNGTPVDATKYRSMIGALMYLTSSRPNIMHATCLCARYQAKPTKKHLKEVKRIVCYLRGTVNTGLCSSPQELDRLAKSHQSQRDLLRNTTLDRVEVLEEGEKEKKDNLENINTNPSPPPDPSVSIITKKVCKLSSFFESLGLVPQSSNTEIVCTKGDDNDMMFIEIIKQDDDLHIEEPEVGENAGTRESEVQYFDVLPTRSELAYHNYLMGGPIPSIFLRNPIITKGGSMGGCDEPLYYVVSPRDVVIAKPRDAEDHINWLLQHGWHEKALASIEAGQGRSELLDEKIDKFDAAALPLPESLVVAGLMTMAAATHMAKKRPALGHYGYVIN
uniref:Copia protein n=1 Tax=Tanacetum cinerariifolium TaxID=118510 RepID=A0A6L2KAE2_TANCI|nr:copia protein [Tanacetum cinerariifolium]